MDGTLSRYYARFLFVSLFFFTFSTAVAVVVTTAVGGEVSLWEGRRYQTRPVPLDDARLPTEPLNGPPFSMKETHRSFRSNVDPTSVLFFFFFLFSPDCLPPSRFSSSFSSPREVRLFVLEHLLSFPLVFDRVPRTIPRPGPSKRRAFDSRDTVRLRKTK